MAQTDERYEHPQHPAANQHEEKVCKTAGRAIQYVVHLCHLLLVTQDT